jgi:DDE_Tnp_1-associated
MASSPARVVGEQAPVALPAGLPAHLTASLVAELGDSDPVATSSLAAALAAVPDARRRRGRRHELTGVLAIGACACLTGATSYVAIGEWAAAQGQAVLDCLGEGGTASDRVLPCEATLRRCVQGTDSAALDAAVTGWAVGRLTARQALAAGANGGLVPADPGRRVIAIDGKTLRGSAPRAPPEQSAAAAQGGGRTHLVAAFDHASGVTLGQVACAPEAGTGGEGGGRQAAGRRPRRARSAGRVGDHRRRRVHRPGARRRPALGRRALDAADQGHPEDAAHPAQGAALGAGARGRPGPLGRPRPGRDPHHPGGRPGRQQRRARRVLPRRGQALKIVRRRRTRRGRWSVQTVYAITSLDARQGRSGAAGLLDARALAHRGAPALGPRRGPR